MQVGSPVLDALDVAVVIQDAEYRITYANQRAIQLLGISALEITQRTTFDPRWDVITPDGATVADDGHPAVQAMRTGEAVRGVVLGVRLRDTVDRNWIIVSAIPEKDADGRVTQVVVSFNDVSEMQRAVRESEALYRTVFASMSEGLAVHAPDGSIRAANAAATRVLGLSEDQLTGRAATDPRWRLVEADGSALDPAQIPSEVARRTGETVAGRSLGVHKPGGELCWLSVRADPLREPDDPTLRGVVATFTDVTNEVQTRRALQRSEAHVRRVLEALPGVVYQYLHPVEGPDRIVFMGGRLKELLGFELHALREQSPRFLEQVHPADREATAAAVARAVSAGAIFEHELRISHPERGVRWLRLRGVPERTPEGLLYTGFILDVTEARELAERLRRTQRREAMAQMAAGVAHNFNNMLAAILPNIELAREDASATSRDLLLDAERAAVSAGDLVRRMLALGRTEPAARDSVVDLVPIVREALHICRQTFDRGIDIQEEIGVATAPVHGTASELQQVVLNLCLNARDAMEGQQRRVLAIALMPDEHGGVLLRVRDTGHGMDDATLKRLGEPFFSTKDIGRGTGLGLASAFHTITEAGGSWTIQSEVGAGTTFTVSLPVRAVTPSGPAAAVVPATPVPAGTLLVIDDEEMVRRALSRLLARAGYRMLEAQNADEAIAVLADLAADTELTAILLDRSMPGVSGDELLPRLRALRPDTPVVVLSGHIDERARLDEAAAVLQKPVSSRDVLDVLARVKRPR